MRRILIPDKVWIEGNTVYASGNLDTRRAFSAVLLQLGIVDIFGTIINPHAFDAFMQQHVVPAIGQDSAMEIADDYQS